MFLPLNFLHLFVNFVMNITQIMFSVYAMFQTELEAMSGQLEQAETKAIQLSQKNSSLESQLADAQVNIAAAPEKQQFAYAKTKTQMSCAVTAQLISAFVFATQIVLALLKI